MTAVREYILNYKNSCSLAQNMKNMDKMQNMRGFLQIDAS